MSQTLDPVTESAAPRPAVARRPLRKRAMHQIRRLHLYFGLFLFPWAVNFRSLGLFGLVEMFTFIGVLLAGFVYILKKGALKWD